MGKLDGRVAFITGASRGIGKGIARRFAAEGAAVVVNSPVMGEEEGLPGTLESAVADIEAEGGKAAAVACDLSDAEARSDLIARAGEFFGPVDILVNNAAVGIMKVGSEITTEDLRFMFEVNVCACIDLAQQCLPHMKSQGQGWILNITSGSTDQAELPYPNGFPKEGSWTMSGYGSSKAALNRYTECLAHELYDQGIFVNAMKPTAIVLTEGADWTRPIAKSNPNMLEPLEMMAEGALEFCSGRHVGRICASRDIVHYVGGKVYSLDGKTVIGDAFLLGDPDSTAGA